MHSIISRVRTQEKGVRTEIGKDRNLKGVFYFFVCSASVLIIFLPGFFSYGGHTRSSLCQCAVLIVLLGDVWRGTIISR